MNIHLIRSEGVGLETYEEVLELLQQFEGPLQFIGSAYESELHEDQLYEEELDEESFRQKKLPPSYSVDEDAMSAPIEFPVHRLAASFSDLLGECEQYRNDEDIGTDEFVILLTDIANEYNWFSYASDKANDIFIHSEGWDYFVGSDLRFPLTHQVATNILQKLMFQQMTKLKAAVHEHPRGCINDFCREKKDISLKMRTGDICHDCQVILQEKKVPPAIINQVLNIIESIRAQMLFKDRFKYNLRPSSLEIRGPDKRIYLTDLEDFKVKLTPLERTVFLFFMDRPEGMAVNSLYAHEDELYAIYQRVSSATDDRTVAAMRNSIIQLADPLSNSLHEKISRVNRKFQSAVGEEMAQHYMILKDRESDVHRINLDRALVIVNS